jgi:thiol-disulfide isomerase/thioredoxin
VTIVASKTQLAAALAGRKVAALFTASWCPFCRSFDPVFDAAPVAAAGFEPLRVMLDDEDNPLWAEYHVDVVPTVIFFDDARIVRRLDGRVRIGLDGNALEQALRG